MSEKEQENSSGTGEKVPGPRKEPGNGISGPEAASDTAGTDISFIKEKVKERPINRRKLLKRTILTASMAVIFGLIACFTFLVLEPVISNWLYPKEEPEPIQLQEENASEEMLPQDMVLETEEETESTPPPAPSTVVQRVELNVSDYQKLYADMYQVVQEASRCLVTVTGVTSEMDWFDNPYENKGQTTGMIVAENGKELLILTEKEIVEQAESTHVTFCDGARAAAELKQADATTGLAVISVSLEELEEKTGEAVSVAQLGNSNGSSLLGQPVAALGQPMGNASSVVYGMITSVDSILNLADGNYRLLATDIYGSENSSGILINLSGQVLGIISQENSSEDARNRITALGISDLKNIIVKLSNGQPMAGIGIYGADVPEEIQETQGVPAGACVTGIVMDSPAMVAGIQSGDVIVKIGTEDVTSFADYSSAMMTLLPDTEVTLTVMRQAQEEYQEMTVDVILTVLE